MQQLVKEKIQNLKAIAQVNNCSGLVQQLTDAQKRTFPSVQAVEEWFKSVLKQQKNYQLTMKWMNVFQRIQVYRDAWREIKKGNQNDMLDIYKVLSAAQSKLTLTSKDEIVQLTTKITIGITKEPKIKQYRDIYKQKVQQLAQARKQKDKGKSFQKPVTFNPIKQTKPQTNSATLKPPSTEKILPQKYPNQKKLIQKGASQSQQKPQANPSTIKIDKIPISKPPREQKKQQSIKAPEPRKEFPSFAQAKISKPVITQSITTSFAPLKPKSIVNPHDQCRSIEDKITQSKFMVSDKNVVATIKKQLNSHMKSVLIKLIKLAGLGNPLGNQDQFTYFSKKNELNKTHFPNPQIPLHQKVPRKDRFMKITYPHKLKIFCQLRIEQEKQEQKLRVQDKRKRKQAQKEVFEFVRGQQRAPKTYQFKQENTKLQKVMIKLPVVQTMMELDPFYSKSRILHMSYYL